MSQPPTQMSGDDVALADISDAGAEKNASTSTSRATTRPGKPRSCVVCRKRKVRCDKLQPCTNCRLANIACVVPTNDRPPRWARRLDRLTQDASATGTPSTLPSAAPPEPVSGTAQVMERLRKLEGLVKDLNSQLEHARVSSSPGTAASSSPPATSTTDTQKHFGRLVLQHPDRSRYVGSGFWSRVSDEIDGLKIDAQGLAGDDSDTSDDEASSKMPDTKELDRTPLERHAFLFRRNLIQPTPTLADFRPLPSQIPFLLDTFAENVNFLIQIVHMPTLRNIVRTGPRAKAPALSPSNEALMFSVYYAAVTSMEEEDVTANFGTSKAELNLRFRLGLEQALAEADFLNAPNLTLVQALANFLFLVKRHDSPRFVWMMTGVAIRMAQAIGLHRDGSNFKNMTPYGVEMRRRAWWAICALDIRASEDQGTEFSIPIDSFDTRMPLNINDADISPDTKETPAERQGLTDILFPLAMLHTCVTVRRMMAPGARDGGPGLEEQARLVGEISEKMDETYPQRLMEAEDITYWVGQVVSRLVVAKLTLLIYLPALFNSPDQRFSEEVRDKLLTAAIEVAEYNHALNAEPDARQWRWLYQTYTHWYAIVYLLIETGRRPWSPLVERAWTALHSDWLIPSQARMNKNARTWVPLRKLRVKAREHRAREVERLRADNSAAEQLLIQDQRIPVPASPSLVLGNHSEGTFLERWRSLLARPSEASICSQPVTSTSLKPMDELGRKDDGSQAMVTMQHHDWSNANHHATNHNYPHNYSPTSWPADQPFAADENFWHAEDAVNTGDALAEMDLDSTLAMDWNDWVNTAMGIEQME